MNKEETSMAIKLQIEKRSGIGKNKVDKIRNEEMIPAIIYAKAEENILAKVDAREFMKVFRQAGSSTLIELEVDGEKLPVIVKDVQRHPVKNHVIHIDFQKLNMKEKVRITVPVVLVNRDTIKLQPSVLMQLLDQVDVECLPAHMPNTADVDVEDMDFTTPMLVKDLDIAKDENITILRDLDDVVCTLSEPTIIEDEVEESEEVEAGEVEVVGEESQE